MGRVTTSIAFEAAGVLLMLVGSACTSASSGPTTTVVNVPEGLPSANTTVYPPDSSGACTKSADCMADQVCCVTDLWTAATDCRHGPCPYLPASSGWAGGPIQLCRTAAECLVAGDVCPELPNAGNLALVCQAPLDAGSTSEPDAAPPADKDADAATDAAADASTQGAGEAGGPCTTNSDCPTADWCLFRVGDCSAHGQCLPPTSLGALCNIAVAYCGCDGTRVTGLCGQPYAFGPTLGRDGGSGCEGDASTD